MSRYLHRTALATLCLGATIVANTSTAHADGDPSVFQLNTACIGLKDAMKTPYSPSRCTGSGAFDANTARLAMPDGTQRFFVAWDDAGTWRQNSGMEARYALVDLSKDGLKIIKENSWLGSAQFNKDRLFMRPVITVLPGDAMSAGYFLLTGASEDNGTSNNPRTTALLYDADGNAILNIAGPGRGANAAKIYGKRGERGVDMGALAGRDNNQQQGASDVHYLGKDGDAHLVAMTFQENNQAAYVAVYRVQINGRGIDPQNPGATITAVNDAVMLQGEARHCRPTCAIAEGTNPATFACATVHANEQPAEKGITVGRFDGKTGALIGEAIDVVAPRTEGTGSLTEASVENGIFRAPTGYRFSQSELKCGDASCSTYVLETSHLKKSKRQNGNDGHTPTAHNTDLLVLDRDTLAVKSYADLGNVPHSSLVSLDYGGGDGAPAFGLLSATLTGAKPATMQVVKMDPISKALMPISANDKYPVANFANQGDIPARGLRNPNNQGRGFLFSRSRAPNPGANGGWMSGISSFTVVPVPNFGTTADATFLGLDLCFVPSTHLTQYTKTAPGRVIRWNEAPVGPPPDPSNPNKTSVENPTGEGAGGGAGSGRRSTAADEGCSSSSRTPDGGDFALVGLMGVIAVVARRRRVGV